MGKNKKKKKKNNIRPIPLQDTANNVKKLDKNTIEIVDEPIKNERIRGASGRFEVKFQDEYCDMLIEHMADGFSFESFGKKIRTGARTLYYWVENYPDFADAKEIGDMAALYADELKLERAKRGDKAINIIATMFSLKTRHHKIYGERVKHTHVDAVTAKIEEESENSNQVLVQLAYKV